MCHYICWSGRCWKELCKHFNAFLVAYQKLVTSTSNEEIASLKVLYCDLLNLLNAGRCGRLPDETPLGRVAFNNIPQFLELSNRAVNLGDTVGLCQLNAEIRFQLLRMLLNYDTTRQLFEIGSYQERELVIITAKCHLQSLKRIFQSTSYWLLLEELQILGYPPFCEDLTFIANSIHMIGSSDAWWPFFFWGHIFFLLCFLLFEVQITIDDFDIVESALMIYCLIAIDSRSNSFHYAYYCLQMHALFLAGLILVELRLPDGISYHFSC